MSISSAYVFICLFNKHIKQLIQTGTRRAPAIDVSLTEPNAGNPKMPLCEQDYKGIPVMVYTERFNEKSIRKQTCVPVSKNMILDK